MQFPFLRLMLPATLLLTLIACSNAQTDNAGSRENTGTDDSEVLLVTGRRVAPGDGNEAGIVAAEIIERFPESRWLRSSSDVLLQLNSQPAECLSTAVDEESRQTLDLGRAAFRNPGLLGVSAAELGLSCNSCHRSGRDNSRFFIAGLSAQPGSVDISSAEFSRPHDDGLFNPLPIPDLLDVDSRQATDLRDYINAVITEDFGGNRPMPEVLSALSEYVDALDSANCPADPFIERNLSSDLEELDRELALLRRAVATDDKELIAFLVTATQHQFNEIYRRYQHLTDTELPVSLNTLSRGLIDLNRVWFTPSDNLLFLDSWEDWFNQLRPELRQLEQNSYYHL